MSSKQKRSIVWKPIIKNSNCSEYLPELLTMSKISQGQNLFNKKFINSCLMHIDFPFMRIFLPLISMRISESDPNEEFTEKESKKPLVVLENENDNTFEFESNSSTTEFSIQVDQSSNEDVQQTASQNSIDENLE
ncbi:hypothetical protein BpHYR1_029745 [Brachionus plicatilis]|uniref:Uncharacterized protein n=1 Tax=Brachionus plicatilis TaxID=10195 RepID=A0A3M7QY08_BRAPC|nr:hypothetical protein BpHYR1_029745 [Brachionus plicatilis]